MKFVISLLIAFALVGHAQEKPKDWEHTLGEDASANRAEWQRLTAGDELARGKTVQYFPKPGYRLTTDDHDPLDLTDGQLSSRADDRIWFAKDAVGWLGVGQAGGILMVIDLGTPQPVGQIAVRILGGKEQGALILPSTIEFLASEDGAHYFTLQKMAKLQPAESALSDFKTAFYLPEEGKAFMAPFVCRQPVLARYIALRVTPESGLFIDELSVLKAPAGLAGALAGNYPETPVHTTGVAVVPKAKPFVVTTNIITPNWVSVQDFSGLEARTSNIGFRLELPEGFELLPTSQPAFQEVTSARAGTRSYEFSRVGAGGHLLDKTIRGPLYIAKQAGAASHPGAAIVLTGLLEGKESHVLRFPLQEVEIPVVAPLEGLEISLAWMSDQEEMRWPQFLENFRKLGFNFVSTFPRSFSKTATGEWSEETKKSLELLKEARRQGYRVVYNESPFHVMFSKIEAVEKAGKLGVEESLEIFNQVRGQRGKWENPLYRGQYFQGEIERVAQLAALVQPDHVYLDIERYNSVIAEAKTDPRVAAAWKQSGKTWEDYITGVGTETLGTLVAAIRQALPERKVKDGLYNSNPGRATDFFFSWPKLYPQVLDLAMPSIYVQGRTADVIERIGTDYRSLQNRKIIPWLTAGTYGEFAPELMEPMVLETVLGGAGGLTYYTFGDFDPMDFYYHAKALSVLAKFPDLLRTGKPLPCHGDNPQLHYTGFGSETEALVLVGNYRKSPKGEVKLPMVLPSARKAVVVDGEADKLLPITNHEVSFIVPPGEFRLIHMTGG